MTWNVYVDRSGIDGNGLFATRDFARGDTVFVLKGTIVRHRVRNKRMALSNPNCVGIGKHTWMQPDYPFMYINHSCNPNMGIKGRTTFVALRAIAKNEELTFDYSITEEQVLWEMRNHEPPCEGFRPIIRSIQFLPKEVYDRYLPYIPRYFQRAYENYHRLARRGQDR